MREILEKGGVVQKMRMGQDLSTYASLILQPGHAQLRLKYMLLSTLDVIERVLFLSLLTTIQ
jgi:hypothetical protein